MDVTGPRSEAGPYAAWRLAMALLVVFIGLRAALQVDANFSWWREQPIQVEMALQPFAEYYSDDTKRVPSKSFAVGTECRRIHYNFGQLRSEQSRLESLRITSRRCMWATSSTSSLRRRLRSGPEFALRFRADVERCASNSVSRERGKGG